MSAETFMDEKFGKGNWYQFKDFGELVDYIDGRDKQPNDKLSHTAPPTT